MKNSDVLQDSKKEKEITYFKGSAKKTQRIRKIL
jgi:hypothetical protein